MAQKTIVYVDDDEDVRMVAVACLEADGYRLLTATNAAHGLKLVFSEFPDMVITDVMMPGESGYSLCHKLRRDPATRDIPVIIVTVLDNEKEAMSAGATAYFSKPFDEVDLRKTVKDILEPSDNRTLLNQGLDLVRSNQVDQALAKFAEIVKSEPSTGLGIWARYYVAQIHHQQGDGARASEELRALLTIDGGFFRAHNRLGLIHGQADDAKRAIRHYQRSLVLNPSQPEVQQCLQSLQKTL